MRLAGTYHPIDYILTRLEDFIPSLIHTGAIYSVDQQLLFVLDGDKIIFDALQQVQLQKIRTQRPFTTQWVESHNLLEQSTNSNQKSLYDEEKNTTLLVHLPSSKNDLSDILLLTFPGQLVMKDTDNAFSGMSTSEKSLITNFLLNIVKSEFNRVLAESRLVEGFVDVQKAQLAKRQNLEQTLEETKRLYLNSLKVLIVEYFEKLSSSYDCTFIPSSDLVERIGQLQLGIEDIYYHLQGAAELGYHLMYGEKEITILGSYINERLSATSRVKSNQDIPGNSDKVYQLLERYEDAAADLQALNSAINGKNVALHLSPPVTPPAITDAVKKNQKRISFLLEQYPEKWRLIRKHLKPIERLDNSYLSDFRKAI